MAATGGLSAPKKMLSRTWNVVAKQMGAYTGFAFRCGWSVRRDELLSDLHKAD